MKRWRYLLLTVLCSVPLLHASMPDLTVSKTDPDAMFSSIQAAVDAAQPGMIIEVMDASVYEEQVTIDSTKQGITIRSANPQSISKPVIRWQDTEHTHPHTYEEYQHNIVNYDQNGALRILNVRGVTIDGICVDGGGAYPFAYPSIWNGKDELFHGNAAVCLNRAGGAVIRNCEVKGAFFGFYVNGRNIGGVFGSPNPHDYDVTFPMSGFRKTGDHLIEYNRIHSNSWGFLFESNWDLGSTVRYNLLYNNYHTESTLNQITDYPGSDHQPGGAFQFKDITSPLAVYNNTFWNNYMIFTGHWKPGGQHLIFNNIYGKPKYLWVEGYPGGKYKNPWHAMDGKCFNYRSKHCLYSSQATAPRIQTRKHYVPCADSQEVSAIGIVSISNDLGSADVASGGKTVDFECPDGSVYTIDVDWTKQPGALISGTYIFPEEANIRWLETDDLFRSTDPESPNFLHPDWDDPLVQQFIKNAGWPEAGIRNSDGMIADIGAVPSCGSRQNVVVRIKPISVVHIEETSATVHFDLTAESGQMTNPRIKYLRWIERIPRQSNISFGSTMTPLESSDIHIVNFSGKSLSMGQNVVEFTIPSKDIDTNFAFFELVVEGDGPDGTVVNSDVGFLPFRSLGYGFKVEMRDDAGEEITQVQAGQTVKLYIEPFVRAGSVAFTDTVTELDISNSSGANIYDALTNQPLELSEISEPVTVEVYFTKAGRDNVIASGMLYSSDYSRLAVFGASDEIEVLPGPAEKVIFEKPIPKRVAGDKPPVISMNEQYEVIVNVMDSFHNLVKEPASVSITSLNPDIGGVTGADTVLSDDEGKARFMAEVVNGKYGDVFDLVATLEGNGASDTGALRCGRVRDRLAILYTDSEIENKTVDAQIRLETSVGTRVPVTIIALRGDSVLTERNTEITVTTSPGIQSYASEDTSDAQTTFVLRDGQVTIWLESANEIQNGSISAVPTVENINFGLRDQIYIGGSSPVRHNKLNKKRPAYSLFVYDLRGRMVGRMESMKRNGNMNLLQKRFPAGTYVIRTMLEGKVIETRRRLIGR